jgi:hypothetical protein
VSRLAGPLRRPPEPLCASSAACVVKTEAVWMLSGRSPCWHSSGRAGARFQDKEPGKQGMLGFGQASPGLPAAAAM